MTPFSLTPGELQDYEQAILNRRYLVDEFTWILVTNNRFEIIRITRNTTHRSREYQRINPNSLAQNIWWLEFEQDLMNGVYE